MPHRDDQDAGVTARESVQDVIAKTAWSFEREDHEVDPNIRAHALSIRVQEALTEAGLVIVDAEVLACLIDAAEEYAAGQAARQPVTMHDRADIDYEVRTITAAVSHARAAVAPGAEDAR